MRLKWLDELWTYYCCCHDRYCGSHSKKKCIKFMNNKGQKASYTHQSISSNKWSKIRNKYDENGHGLTRTAGFSPVWSQLRQSHKDTWKSSEAAARHSNSLINGSNLFSHFGQFPMFASKNLNADNRLIKTLKHNLNILLHRNMWVRQIHPEWTQFVYFWQILECL